MMHLLFPMHTSIAKSVGAFLNISLAFSGNSSFGKSISQRASSFSIDSTVMRVRSWSAGIK
jgi:hypothetical protein